MKKIRLCLEWGGYPIQELDSRGFIIDDISPEELGLCKDLSCEVKRLQDMYDSLFIDNNREFEYMGDKKLDVVQKIKEKYIKISKDLIENSNEKDFEIEVIDLTL
ncbi:MAG: hypothetical protein Q4B23_01140 [Helcococcus sp.]|nr:hypothetical protein [Helcococcus sp.]